MLQYSSMENQKHSKKQISYQLIIQQDLNMNSCNGIAIQANNSIVIFAEEKKLIVCTFKNQLFKTINQFKINSSNINTINFFKLGQNFITGCQNSSIYIWSIHQIAKSKYIQKLNANSGSVLCLCISKQEDYIISGHYEQTIKIWSKLGINVQQWTCFQNLVYHTGAVYGLSMNENQNKIISCSNDQQILVYQFSIDNSLWVLQQVIQNDGLRLCFITNDVFVFQPYASDSMQIYTYEGFTSKFINTEEIQIQQGGQFCNEFFPCIYNHNKGLIFNKSSYNINILSCNENKNSLNRKIKQIDFNLQQVIDLGDEYFCGIVSDDGEYLIIWNSEQREIQIREYKERIIV